MTTSPITRALLYGALLGAAACGGGGSGGNGGGGPPPAKPTLSILDLALDEGNAGETPARFTVQLSAALPANLTVGWATSPVTADGADVTLETGTLTIPAGATEALLEVTVLGDAAFEPDETFTVALQGVPASVEPLDLEAFGTIRTDDLPEVRILPAEVIEGDVEPRLLLFEVTLAGPTNELQVGYETADLTALAPGDYTPASGTLTIPAGATLGTIQVTVLGDDLPEPLEKVRVRLTGVEGDAVLDPPFDVADGEIQDDDTPVEVDERLQVVPIAGVEPATPLTFQLTLAVPRAVDVRVGYATRSLGAATAGADYTAKAGQVTIPAGATSVAVEVPVLDDALVENPEALALDLTLVAGDVALAEATVTGYVLDDDYVGPPFLQASLYTGALEGDAGARTARIPVTLSSPAAAEVTVGYVTHDLTALAGSDYDAASGTLTFAPGEVLKWIPVAVHGDLLIEADEVVEVELVNPTGPALLFQDPLNLPWLVLRTDDPFALVRVADAEVLEGDAGEVTVTFAITLSAPAADPVTFDWTTAAAGAVAGLDFVAAGGAISIPAGETSASVTVKVLGDAANEFDEGFDVVLSNVSQNAELADPIGRGTIVNDDGGPGWGVPGLLDQAPGKNVLPEVAVNAAGEGIVAWTERNFTAPFEAVRFSPSAGWSAAEELPGDLPGKIFGLGIDGAGAATLTWFFGASKAARTLPGQGWGPVVEQAFAGRPALDFMSLAVNEAGAALAVWKVDTSVTAVDHVVFTRLDPSAGTWSPVAELAKDAQFVLFPVLAMNAAGAAVAVWTESGGGVRASAFDPVAGTWTAPLSISRELAPGVRAPGYTPAVAIDAAGNALAVWDDGSSVGTSTRGSVWASRRLASTGAWTEPVQLDATTLDATHPQVAMDGAGNAWVVWLQDQNASDSWNDTFDLRARRLDAASGTWGAEALVHDPVLRVSSAALYAGIALDVPALAVDPAGRVTVAWSEKILDRVVIRASRNEGAGWSPPEQVSGDEHPFAAMPDAAADAAGNVLLVWQEGDAEAFGVNDAAWIGATRYTMP